jgi:HK97 family phage portal protein
MSFLDRFFRRERRSETVRSDDPQALAEFFGVRSVGAAANADAVLSNLAVAARCVGIRSEMLASVGLFLFRRTADGGRERADDLPLYGVLHDMWNANLTAFEGRERMIRDLDTHGNAFARVERNARGQVVALWPEPWGSVAVEKLTSGRLRYRVSSSTGGVTVLLQEEALHVRGALRRDGVLGQSPIQIARGALGLALSQTETAAAFAGNMLRPSGLVTFTERLSPAARDLIRSELMNFAGSTNAGKVMVMDGGARFDRMTFSPDDAEFLDSRKLANEDVARIFGVPPTCVGITDKATYSNTEQEARALVQNALGPLAARIESAMSRCLLTEPGRRAYYIEHDLSALLRGDVQARFEAYRIGREIGALSPNDVRRRENEPPIPAGDTYHQPANWVPLGTQATNTGV